jgi:hypothetical protein
MSFSFLNKYKKDSLVRYLASMCLFEQNSSHIVQLSTLLYQALLTDGGNCELVAANFEDDIRTNYPYDLMEDPQGFMYVDVVHSQKGTFRVFPGVFATVQYNLTQLFKVAMAKGIHEDTFGEVYALLDLSDQIAERCGFSRYEKGDCNYSELYCPDDKQSEDKQKHVVFSQGELTPVFERYGQNWDAVRQFIYHDNKEAIKEFLNNRDTYSPIKNTPLFQLTTGDFAVMEPSALLTSAYLRCLAIMSSILHVDDITEEVQEIIKIECHKAIEYADNMCVAVEKFDNVSCLVYHFDADKVARICISACQGFEDGVKKCDEMVAKRWPGKKVMKIHVIYSLDFEDPQAFPFEEMVLFADDFKVIMGNEKGSLTTLYDYYKSRSALKGVVICPEEIDMYGYYRSNEDTFYQSTNYSMISLASDSFYDLKCDYLQKRDQHLIDFGNQKIMIRHLEELPTELPIYEPDMSDKVPILVGEYRKSTVVCRFSPENEDEYITLREITKALLVRFFVFEYRHKESLLKAGNYRVEIRFVDAATVLFNMEPNGLFFTISKNFFEKDYQGKTDEQALLEFVLGKMNRYGYVSANDYQTKIQTIFDECKGQMLLTDRNGLDYWLIHDQYDGTYTVNKHKCDEVLDEIANYLNRKGKNVTLDSKVSWDVARQVVDFLGIELDKLLEKYASKEFVLHLLQLHHGTLFWMLTTQLRFEKVNSLMEYVGTHFDGQKELLFEYSRTNNLTQCLIERIVSKNFCADVTTKDFPLEAIDRIYAYMHQLYNFGSYMDLLLTKACGLEMRILANGRVELPREKIYEQMAYFMDIRENELYRPDAYRRLFSLRRELNIDIDDSVFKDAFKAEFKIDYSQWRSVIDQSLNYAFDRDQHVLDITCDEFEKQILSKVLTQNEIADFQDVFCMSKGMSDGASYSESFIQRFNRQFQISSRPWICYNGRVLYSTNSLHQHEHVILERLNEGKMHARSSKMTAYMREINRKKGTAFEKKLTDFYNTLGLNYIKAYHGVEIGPGEQLENAEKKGDIDVLLINTATKQIVCLETKNYYESRTMYEMYLEKKKTEDDFEMPLKRDAWCRIHITAFSNICKDVDESYTCCSVFVTVNMPAYQYSLDDKESPIKIISALDIIENPMIVFNV